ncbi:MAG: S8 family peptidase [Lachnospiraceae bacterium]|nr:S8 family peptidase [Lachnospiraceae bacterium]
MDRVRKRIHLEQIQENRWSRFPITIAVLDSGISRHPDLEGKCMLYKDFVNGQKEPYDDNGHGTHVCGILSGSGEASRGKYRGIIPNSRLVVGKVLDRRGDGCAEVMLQGLAWVLENYRRYDIRLLNISVGIGNLQDKQKSSRLREMIERLWDEGVLVVCAAGNKGPAEGSISDIGGTTKAVIVGCCDDYDGKKQKEVCEFHSGRGRSGDRIRKPDLVAPGTNIVACSHEAKWIGKQYEKLYVPLSGTSMATAVVTGCAALLLQTASYLNNVQVRERLHYTAEDMSKPWNLQGWGMIDAKSLLENT